VDLEIGYVRNARTDRLVRFSPLPRMLLDLLDQGGIMAVLVKNGYVDAPRSNPTP